MRAFAALTCVVMLAAGCDSAAPIRISRGADSAPSTSSMRAVETLQCPRTQSVLTLRGAPAADGRSCHYTGPRGALVTLRLTAIEGGVEATLDALEAEVQAEMSAALARLGEPASTAGAATENGSGSEAVDLRMPGITIRTRGDSAVVRIPGLSIDADGDQANVRVGGITIRSSDSEGQVDIRGGDALQLRAREEAVEVRARENDGDVRATYILVDERGADSGWRLMGVEARGPSGGPLVVAVVHSKDRRQDEVFDAAKSLVSLNVGG